jgi:hypothetical protein
MSSAWTGTMAAMAEPQARRVLPAVVGYAIRSGGVEGLRVLLWLRGIGQWCLGAVDFWSQLAGSPSSCRSPLGEEEAWDRERMAIEEGSAALTWPSHGCARP